MLLRYSISVRQALYHDNSCIKTEYWFPNEIMGNNKVLNKHRFMVKVIRFHDNIIQWQYLKKYAPCVKFTTVHNIGDTYFCWRSSACTSLQHVPGFESAWHALNAWRKHLYVNTKSAWKLCWTKVFYTISSHLISSCFHDCVAVLRMWRGRECSVIT